MKNQYRYVLPCGHHSYMKCGEVPGPLQEKNHHYRCKTCGQKFVGIYDKKRNKVVGIGQNQLSEEKKEWVEKQQKVNREYIKENNGRKHD